MTANPNTNCLEGLQCPHCQSYGPFKIDAFVTVLVSDEGTEDTGGDYEWHADNRCICADCDYAATIADFTEKEHQ